MELPFQTPAGRIFCLIWLLRQLQSNIRNPVSNFKEQTGPTTNPTIFCSPQALGLVLPTELHRIQTHEMMQCKQHSTFCITPDSCALKCVNPARRNHTSVHKNNNPVCEASHEFSEGCMSTLNKPPQNRKYSIQLEALCRESPFHCGRNRLNIPRKAH